MNELIEHLKHSIADGNLSSSERKVLKSFLKETPLSQQQRMVLRSQMYALAHQHIHAGNFRHVLDWLKDVTSSLHATESEQAEAWFSPGEACRKSIVQQLNTASRDVKICVFTISDDLIVEEIVRVSKNGLTVQIITDNDKLQDEGSDVNYLARQGIPVKVDETPNHMHHKFMVVDGKLVLTGSYNWTRSAALYNHENLMLTTSAGVVKSYLKEFDHLWRIMKDYPG
jgi:mitochondrial cardiolipin hydrolase